MEQRYDAVLGVIRHRFTVTDVATKFGVSRQLGEGSHRPKISPNQIPAATSAC
jgi:hypothetical protein